MLAATVLTIVRDTLKNSALSTLIDPEVIQVTPDEKPWPMTGEWFVCVHASSLTNPAPLTSQAKYRKLDYNVTVVKRTRVTPNDRLGETVYLDLQTSMATLLSAIIEIIDSNITIHADIRSLYETNVTRLDNTLLTNLLQGYQLITPFSKLLIADMMPIPKFNEFFNASTDQETYSDRPAGHTMTARFTGPTWIQAIDC